VDLFWSFSSRENLQSDFFLNSADGHPKVQSSSEWFPYPIKIETTIANRTVLVLSSPQVELGIQTMGCLNGSPESKLLQCVPRAILLLVSPSVRVLVLLGAGGARDGTCSDSRACIEGHNSGAVYARTREVRFRMLCLSLKS
jgi:hypothetical protein